MLLSWSTFGQITHSPKIYINWMASWDEWTSRTHTVLMRWDLFWMITLFSMGQLVHFQRKHTFKCIKNVPFLPSWHDDSLRFYSPIHFLSFVYLAFLLLYICIFWLNSWCLLFFYCLSSLFCFLHLKSHAELQANKTKTANIWLIIFLHFAYVEFCCSFALTTDQFIYALIKAYQKNKCGYTLDAAPK